MNSNKITNIGNPTNDLDAANKRYVDEKFTSITKKLSTHPEVIRKELEHTFASLHVFDNFYQLGHNIPPFERGINVSSSTSTENSFSGVPYERYTSLNTNAYTLHLTPLPINMRPGKSYIFRLLVRGVGKIIGKK